MRRLAQARNPYSRTWLWIPGSRSARPGMTKYFTPTNSLRPLPQPRQHLQSAVTVGGQQPHLGLIIPDRLHGVVADAAIGAAGVEAGLGETHLHFLHFGECQRALRTWERLDERRCAENAVAEMTDRQRVIHRWIVTAHGVEIRPQQEGWSALHRHPHLRGGTWLRKRLAVGARDAGAGPCRIAAAAAGRCARRAHLMAPMFAAVILAAVDQKARAGTQRVIGLAERRYSSILVVIHPDIEPDFRHPLGMPHRAGPRSPHLLGRAPAAIDDLEGVDQLGFPIGAAARFVPGKRRQRRKYRPHMI